MNDSNVYIRALELAQLAGVHADQIKRRIFEGVLIPDAWVHFGGKPKTPLFLKSHAGEHVRTVLDNRLSLPKRSVSEQTEVVR